MKAKTTGIGVLVSALILSGCASIVGDNQYPVAINSSPSGIVFEISNRAGDVIHSGVTPATVTLDSSAGYFKGEKYMVRFSKAGYDGKSESLASQISGWYWGNILLGGLIGMLIVDPATGSMYKLPQEVKVDLQRQAADDSLTILSIDELSVTERDLLVPLP
ncbi:MAG: hypothetical protein WC997_09345 [Porticoccaceae bacterium]